MPTANLGTTRQTLGARGGRRWFRQRSRIPAGRRRGDATGGHDETEDRRVQMTQRGPTLKKLLTLLAAGVLTLGVAGNVLATESSEGTVDHDSDETTAEVDNNQVDCGEATVPLDPIGTQINAGGDPAEGGFVEACADGDVLPIQGAIYAEGSTAGGAVAADGDGDNPEGDAQGWARVGVSADGASVACGDAYGGESDGGDYNSRDGGGAQENCG